MFTVMKVFHSLDRTAEQIFSQADTTSYKPTDPFDIRVAKHSICCFLGQIYSVFFFFLLNKIALKLECPLHPLSVFSIYFNLI